MIKRVTFVTPIAPKHVDLYERALLSVAAQTQPMAEAISLLDEVGFNRGPGHLRNLMLQKVTTEFVVFLDADDWVEPDFVDWMLAATKPGRYVYCDWFQDGVAHEAPKRPWCNGTFHLVTSLVPTELALKVGGFDEGLRGMEDTDFFIKLSLAGHCGIRVPVPLVHYSAGGGRGQAIHESGEIDEIRKELTTRYGGSRMACCGDPAPEDNSPIGSQQPGDVLATALWGGNRVVHGRVTNRRYPRISWPHQTWVDPRDLAKAPEMWQEVYEAPPAPPPPGGLDALEDALISHGIFKDPPFVKDGATILGPTSPADFSRIRTLAGVPEPDGPIFVRPDEDYPSYSDFWRLVDLAGFKTQSLGAPILPGGTYIVVTPTSVPSLDRTGARIIFWQLEYTGDYTDQRGKETIAEHWSSDPAHAARTGSKFVLLGSDVRLKTGNAFTLALAPYDFIFLAYLTDRRRVILSRLIKAGFTTPPDYPGHDTAKRGNQLAGSKLMVAVHQNDEKALAPLRIALAAAYSLPVLSEDVDDWGPYGQLVHFAKYQSIAKKAKELLAGGVSAQGEVLHQALCWEHPFRDCVLEALK